MAKYRHHRQKSPELFIKKTFRTVPLSHTEYAGKKFRVRGAKAIVGKLKPANRTKTKWTIQSILTPK